MRDFSIERIKAWSQFLLTFIAACVIFGLGTALIYLIGAPLALFFSHCVAMLIGAIGTYVWPPFGKSLLFDILEWVEATYQNTYDILTIVQRSRHTPVQHQDPWGEEEEVESVDYGLVEGFPDIVFEAIRPTRTEEGRSWIISVSRPNYTPRYVSGWDDREISYTRHINDACPIDQKKVALRAASIVHRRLEQRFRVAVVPLVLETDWQGNDDLRCAS